MTKTKAVAVIGGGLGGLAAACVLAARGHRPILFDKNGWVGGKAAVLARGRLPLRHGADHPHRAARARAHLRRGRPQHDGSARPAPPRSAMALLLRRRLADRPRRGRRRDGGQHGPLRAGPRRRRRLPPLPEALGAAARRVEPVLLLEGRRRSVRHDGHARQPQSVDPARRDVAAHGRLGRRHDPLARQGRPPRADARSLHAICRLLALRVSGGALRDRPHADGGGRRGTRWAARTPWRKPWRSSPSSSARTIRTGVEITGLDLSGGAVRGVAHRVRRELRLRRRRLQHGFDPHLPGTRRRRDGRPLRAQGLRARLLGRRALSRPRPALRSSRPPRFRVLARSGGGVRLHLPARRAGARPDLLSRRPVDHGSERRAVGRRGALHSRARAVSAPASRLERACCPTTGA